MQYTIYDIIRTNFVWQNKRIALYYSFYFILYLFL